MPAVKSHTRKQKGKAVHVEGHLRKRSKIQRGGVGVPLNTIRTPIDRVKTPINK